MNQVVSVHVGRGNVETYDVMYPVKGTHKREKGLPLCLLESGWPVPEPRASRSGQRDSGNERVLRELERKVEILQQEKVRARACVRTCLCAYVRACTCVFVHAYMRACASACVHCACFHDAYFISCRKISRRKPTHTSPVPTSA